MTDPIAMLQARRNGRTLKEFAAEIPCTEGYLSLLLNGHREPGVKVLKYLGIDKEVERRVVYKHVRNGRKR